MDIIKTQIKSHVACVHGSALKHLEMTAWSSALSVVIKVKNNILLT